MAQQNWTDSVKATFSTCLCSKTTSDSDDERDRQQGGASSSTGTAATGGRHIFARDELEGLLASASSDEDVDAMSLHSNVGGSRRSKKKKGKGKGKQKRRDAWGVVGRNLSVNSRRSIQMFGWYPFGRPIALPESSDEEDGGQREGRRARTLSTTTNDSDAAPLDSADIASRVTEEEQRKKNLDLMRANFEPEMTNEDLEREERELAEQEEAAAVYTFSFPAVPPTPPVEPPAEPEPEPEAPSTQEPEPEEEEESVPPPPSVADDQTFVTDDTPATESSSPTLPRTPLSPSSSTKQSEPSTPAATATSTPLSHADRIKKAAKEQRRRMREEAARRKKEEVERRAEAAAGGFAFEEHQEQQQPQEFGEFIVGQHEAGVAWTESDGASSQHYQQPPPLPAMHIPIAPMHGLPLHHQTHPGEHPLSPSDDELMDYGAEYAASRRPRKPTAFGVDSASGSDRLERMSNGSGGAGRVRPHMVPLPASTFGSPRKPTILHRNTGSGTLSSHSGLSGQAGQAYYQPVAPVQFQPPVHAEPMEFDGVPGGLDDLHPPPSAGLAHHQAEYVLAHGEYNPPFQAAQEFDGIPGGLNSRHARSRAGSVMDLGTPAAKRPAPQRSHTTSVDSVGMGMSGGSGFPSTGFGSSIGGGATPGRSRAGSRARTLESGVAAAMLGRNAE